MLQLAKRGKCNNKKTTMASQTHAFKHTQILVGKK